jgi:hypothetical protein
MYDPTLGRWISPDPYSQFHSAYLGMGNNPVNLTDPNGGKILPYNELTETAGIDVTLVAKFGIDYMNIKSASYMPAIEITPEMHSINNYNTYTNEAGDLVKSQYFGGVATIPSTEQQLGMYRAADIIGTWSGGLIEFFMGGFADRIVAKYLYRFSGSQLEVPILRSLGSASKAEMLARRLKINININSPYARPESASQRQVLNLVLLLAHVLPY